MIRSDWELHFGEQCNSKKGCGFKRVNAMVPQRRVFRMIGAAGELDYFSAYIRLRKPDKSEDKADDDESNGAQLPKSKASVRKEVDLEEHHSAVETDLSIVKDSRAMGLAAPWYRRGGTSVESSIPCSHGG
ncbi:hypothetical protein B296_00036176 [Ensete ventricosum]|uniref:Uncharacterized protein n=1 Tax=Ensete ventricosum TaxID=4639 RepID=A0A426X522_ENSVE|nr:hypothetical protein B296_00036176 [Ensete ventricosum]